MDDGPPFIPLTQRVIFGVVVEFFHGLLFYYMSLLCLFHWELYHFRKPLLCINFYVYEIFLMSQTLCYKLSLRTTLAPNSKQDMVFKPVDSFHKENENCLRISFIWRIFFLISFYEIHEPLNSKSKIKKKMRHGIQNQWVDSTKK